MTTSMMPFKDPTALVWMVPVLWAASPPFLNKISMKGLSMPREISPKSVESKVKRRYTSNLPLYFDIYWRIRENFFINLRHRLRGKFSGCVVITRVNVVVPDELKLLNLCRKANDRSKREPCYNRSSVIFSSALVWA